MFGLVIHIGIIGTCLFNNVNAHGYISQPTAIYNDPFTQNNFIAIVNADQLFPEYKWNDSPQANFNQYEKLLQSNKIGELKYFFDSYIDGCPKNKIVDAIDTTGMTTMNWQNDQDLEGLISSHTGPCEIWFDDIKVFSDNNCASDYTSYPAKLPIDYSKCNGECLLQFYWMALHEPNWQLYKGCVKIKGTIQSNDSKLFDPSDSFIIQYNSKSFTCTITDN